jgi:hypothetical protein
MRPLRSLEGLWQNGGEKERDSIAVIEVMADEFDRAYWRSLRERLERELMQNEIVIRAQAIQLPSFLDLKIMCLSRSDIRCRVYGSH